MIEKRGSAGGKAYALIQKEQAKKRIDNYNLNPNICLNCGNQILADYNHRLNDIKRRKFCSRKCSYNYNKANLHRKYDNHIDKQSFIQKLSDYEIINIFNESKSIKEFGEKLGYKNLQYRNKSVCNKLKTLGLCIDDLRLKETISIVNRTKGYVFEKYSNWQTARAQIQKLARITYEKSCKPKQCIICGYNKHYEVAHIKAVSDFNVNALVSEIDDINNLIALCPNHHWEYDNDGLDIQQYLDKLY